MPFSTYLGNKIIDHLLRNQAFTSPSAVYASLHTADPGLTGDNEVTGGSYGRQVVALAAANSKATTNSGGAISYTSMPACNVLWAGLWDEVNNGNFLMSGSLSGSKVVNSGDTFQFPINDFDITMS